MFKNICIILLGIFLFLTIAGCGSTQVANTNESTSSISDADTVKEEDIPASESIQILVSDKIGEIYNEANDIKFEDYKSLDNISYLAFSFNNDNSPYYGFAVAEKDESNLFTLSYFEEYPINQEQPATVFQFVGTYPGTENREFHITAGYVNREQIEKVTLYYPNTNIKIIQLGDEQNGFLDIDINSGSESSLLQMECESSDGNIVYQENFDKS